jgi:hypothetical protein
MIGSLTGRAGPQGIRFKCLAEATHLRKVGNRSPPNAISTQSDTIQLRQKSPVALRAHVVGRRARYQSPVAREGPQRRSLDGNEASAEIVSAAACQIQYSIRAPSAAGGCGRGIRLGLNGGKIGY